MMLDVEGKEIRIDCKIVRIIFLKSLALGNKFL
jgi:hypothetical protein